MRLQQLSVTLAALAFLLPISQGLSNEFVDPSSKYRPKFRYWLPDASVSSDVVAKDIQDAKTAGAGGLEFLPFYLYGMGEETYRRFVQQQPGYVIPKLPDWNKYGFGTRAFTDLFKNAMRAAKEADLLMDFSVGANQGQGVPSVPGTKGLAAELLMGSTTLSPQGSFSAPVPQAKQPSTYILSGLNFMHPLEQFGTPNLTAVIAYQIINQTTNSTTNMTTATLDEASFIDLTSKVKQGNTLQWTPPDLTKSWTIFTFWEAYTNQRSCDGGPNATEFIGNGSWTVDHFSAAGAARVTDFWDDYILSDGEIAELVKSVGNYAWEDSMEILAALYWTPGLLNRFRNTYGYDLLSCLPVLFSSSNTWNGLLPVYNQSYYFDNANRTGACQLDYRTVLNDGYQEYLSHFRDWAHSIGVQFSTQPAYNLPLQMLSDEVLLDAPEGESLGFGQLMDVYRQFAGPAHLANISVISTELGAVRVPPYSLRIPDLLQQIKRSFAGGFTMNVLHGFPSSTVYKNTTWPGYTTFFYEFTEMWNQIQPAWQHMRDSLDYVARTQWVLQQGSPQVDLAFYLYASPWSPTDLQNGSTNLQDQGFTLDYIGPDNIASTHAFVNNKQLGVPSYKAIVFNGQTVATSTVANKLVEFASSGLPIIFIGSPPTDTYPATSADRETLLASLTRLLSMDNVYLIDSIDELSSLFAAQDINPRTALDCASNPVYTTRRTSEEMDYIYVFNDQPISTACNISFYDSGNARPFIYNAVTGSKHLLSTFSRTKSLLTTSVLLNSNETLIFGLHKGAAEHPEACTAFSMVANATSANLATWDLVVEDWHSAPDRFAIETEITNHTYHNISLEAWNDIDASLSVVSGIGHYTTQVRVPATSPSSETMTGILSLPPIQHTARVYLDGAWLGPIDPVRPVVEIKDIKPGSAHELRIDVTTTLFNRVKAEADKIWVVGQVAGLQRYASLPDEGYGLVGNVTVQWFAGRTGDC